MLKTFNRSSLVTIDKFEIDNILEFLVIYDEINDMFSKEIFTFEYISAKEYTIGYVAEILHCS